MKQKKRTFIERVIFCFIIITLMTAVYTVFGWESKKWVGLDKSNDSTIVDKIINRFYFTCITISTIGYGNIGPKDNTLKIITSINSIIIILGLVELFKV